MKDNMKPCQHTLPDDVVYKDVVVIGNGPSGMVTSFMLAGNVPYLKPIPEDLPIDDMLRARLSNLPEGQSLYETDLTQLAEGLEGRSQNPIPLLMDNLLRPCADMGIEADSLIEWKFDAEKQIEHIVLGRGPAGGAWHSFPPRVRTLSPGAWLTLPPHAPRGAARLSARAVAAYCRRYVTACQLQRYFRCNVIVTSVTRAPRSERCPAPSCPRNANYCVTGYDKSSGRQFRYVSRRVVVASGSSRPNSLAHIQPYAIHDLGYLERALDLLAANDASTPTPSPVGRSVLVVGSGVSAADAVRAARARRLHAAHLHRAPAAALARLAPATYPDYCQVYQMMTDGPSGNHPNYTPYPDHLIVSVTPEPTPPTPTQFNTEEIEDYPINLKRVKLLNLKTNETTEILVNVIAVFIGSKPDLFFLRTNFNLDCINLKNDCKKCTKQIEEKCFLKNHWHYLKSVLGQSIQICKNRYSNIEENCDCDDKCDNVIPYSNKFDCQCDQNSFTDGIGFGVDPDKAVDSRNPIAIDKSTHEVLNAPKGMYALGPLTADNFIRFIPGGALAIVSHIHKDK